MKPFVLPAAASMVAGSVLGAAVIFGVTLVVDHETYATANQVEEQSSELNRVEYGDRCYHGHCLPCDSKQGCLDKLPKAPWPFG